MEVIEIIQIEKSLNEALIAVGFGDTPEDQADVVVSYEFDEEWNVSNIYVEAVYFNENKGNYFAVKNFTLESSRVIDLISQEY